jgi:hypothetical protein
MSLTNNKYYEAYIQKLINVNPVEITVNRKVSTPDGYGGNTSINQAQAAQTVGIFNQIERGGLIAVKGVVLSKTLSILAPGDANLEESDTFAYGGKVVRVKDLKSYSDICKQGTLEEIGND